jgi:hypothetical protein
MDTAGDTANGSGAAIGSSSNDKWRTTSPAEGGRVDTSVDTAMGSGAAISAAAMKNDGDELVISATLTI